MARRRARRGSSAGGGGTTSASIPYSASDPLGDDGRVRQVAGRPSAPPPGPSASAAPAAPRRPRAPGGRGRAGSGPTGRASARACGSRRSSCPRRGLRAPSRSSCRRRHPPRSAVARTTAQAAAARPVVTPKRRDPVERQRPHIDARRTPGRCPPGRRATCKRGASGNARASESTTRSAPPRWVR